MAEVFVFGSSGHAKVVIETIEAGGRYAVGAVFDDLASRHGQTVLGRPVVGGREALLERRTAFDAGVVAIGDNAGRASVAGWLAQQGFGFVTAIHPGSHVSRHASIGPGTLIAAGCVVQPDARIGAHCIINTGASVDHDCTVGDFTHVAPGCRLCGRVTLGERVLIGVGSVAIPGVRVGASAVIGAGSVVTADIPGGVTAVGAPARPVKSAGKPS